MKKADLRQHQDDHNRQNTCDGPARRLSVTIAVRKRLREESVRVFDEAPVLSA